MQNTLHDLGFIREKASSWQEIWHGPRSSRVVLSVLKEGGVEAEVSWFAKTTLPSSKRLSTLRVRTTYKAATLNRYLKGVVQ